MKKIVVTGAAGLVGQNLIPHLISDARTEVVGIDKHPRNVAVLRDLHPKLRVIQADLASPGAWESELEGCTHLVIGHAQIGGLYAAEFIRNNIDATERLLQVALKCNVGYAVNISSSVVNSLAIDDYTETKKAQEALIVSSGIKQVILRPTLMFGWFDRKHIGWLARFMRSVPVFPIPGNGRYLRQPLFAGDFSSIIASALQTEITGAYNITGLERIDYIDLIRLLKQVTGSRAHIQRIPYKLFWLMLRAYHLIDRNPPFTAKQLEALITPDVFEVIDWPGIFGVRPTPLEEAFKITFQQPVYSKVVLEF